jgi:ankyrin repeat protein
MLHAAARDQNIDMIEELAAWGVDLDAPRGDGQTALDSTARSGYQFATLALLRLGADPRKSMHAIAGATSWGHAEILDQMLAKGGKVNQELNGMTCLRWALEMGYEDCAEVLQKYDAIGQERKPIALIGRARKRRYRGFLKAVAEKHPEWAKECEISGCCCFPFL